MLKFLSFRFSVLNFLLLSFLFGLILCKDCPNKKINSKLVCYYSKLKDIDTCYCTHLVLPSNSDLNEIQDVRKKLAGTGVKILLTASEFNQGLIDSAKSKDIDGLEIKLTKLESKNDITEFVSTVRERIGSDLFLAVSVPPKTELLAKYYDLKALTKTTDLFILQTAFLGASRNVTFHPSRLSDGLWDMQNTDSVVDLVSGLGAPLSKVVITAPVQAFQFKLQDERFTTPGSPAIELKTITRDELCIKMGSGDNWVLERDQDQAGPYIFRKSQWISFEDSTSMDIKAKYARVRGLAGLAMKDLSMDGGVKCGESLLEAAHTGLSKQARAPRAAVLNSLEREILETPARPFDTVHLSPYRISRVIDVEGHVHTIRKDTRTEFTCTRQGYFVHPRSCGRFYRCVKFDQHVDDFNVFEFDCPAGLAFDERVEVCVWPGSLPHGKPCEGSSEIAPVPRERFACPGKAGYYADPENCRWFFACLDHGKSGLTAYEFRCPFGLLFDESRLLCEWPWLVPTCASGQHLGLELDSIHFYGGLSGETYQSSGHANVNGANLQVQAGHNLHLLDSYDGLGAIGRVELGGYHGNLDEFGKLHGYNIGGSANGVISGAGANAYVADSGLGLAGSLEASHGGANNLHLVDTGATVAHSNLGSANFGASSGIGLGLATTNFDAAQNGATNLHLVGSGATLGHSNLGSASFGASSGLSLGLSNSKFEASQNRVANLHLVDSGATLAHSNLGSASFGSSSNSGLGLGLSTAKFEASHNGAANQHLVDTGATLANSNLNSASFGTSGASLSQSNLGSNSFGTYSTSSFDNGKYTSESDSTLNKFGEVQDSAFLSQGGAQYQGNFGLKTSGESYNSGAAYQGATLNLGTDIKYAQGGANLEYFNGKSGFGTLEQNRAFGKGSYSTVSFGQDYLGHLGAQKLNKNSYYLYGNGYEASAQSYAQYLEGLEEQKAKLNYEANLYKNTLHYGAAPSLGNYFAPYSGYVDTSVYKGTSLHGGAISSQQITQSHSKGFDYAPTVTYGTLNPTYYSNLSYVSQYAEEPKYTLHSLESPSFVNLAQKQNVFIGKLGLQQVTAPKFQGHSYQYNLQAPIQKQVYTFPKVQTVSTPVYTQEYRPVSLVQKEVYVSPKLETASIKPLGQSFQSVSFETKTPQVVVSPKVESVTYAPKVEFSATPVYESYSTLGQGYQYETKTPLVQKQVYVAPKIETVSLRPTYKSLGQSFQKVSYQTPKQVYLPKVEVPAYQTVYESKPVYGPPKVETVVPTYQQTYQTYQYQPKVVPAGQSFSTISFQTKTPVLEQKPVYGPPKVDYQQTYQTYAYQPKVPLVEQKQVYIVPKVETVSVAPVVQNQYHGQSFQTVSFHQKTPVVQKEVYVAPKVETVSIKPAVQVQYQEIQAPKLTYGAHQSYQTYNLGLETKSQVVQPQVYVAPKVESVAPTYFYQKKVETKPVVQQVFVTPKVETVSVTPKYEYYETQSVQTPVVHQEVHIKQPVVAVTPKYQQYQQIHAVKQEVLVQPKVETVQTVAPKYETQYYGLQYSKPVVQNYIKEAPKYTYNQGSSYQAIYAQKAKEQKEYVQYQQTVSQAPVVQTYQYVPQKTVLNVKQQTYEYIPPQVPETVHISSNAQSYSTLNQHQSKYAYQEEKVPVKTVTSAPVVYQTYSIQPQKEIVQIKSEPVQQTVYISTPKPVQPVVVSTTPRYEVYQEYTQPKVTPVVQKTYVQPAQQTVYYSTPKPVVVQTTPEYEIFQQYVQPKVTPVVQQTYVQKPVQTVYYSTPKPVVVQTTPKYEVYQEYTQPKVTPVVQQTYVQKPVQTVYYSTPKPVVVQTTPKYEVYQEYTQPKVTPVVQQTYVQPAQQTVYYSTPKPVVVQTTPKYEVYQEYTQPKVTPVVQQTYVQKPVQTVYYSTPKPVVVQKTPKYQVFQEYIQPKVTPVEQVYYSTPKPIQPQKVLVQTTPKYEIYQEYSQIQPQSRPKPIKTYVPEVNYVVSTPKPVSPKVNIFQEYSTPKQTLVVPQHNFQYYQEAKTQTQDYVVSSPRPFAKVQYVSTTSAPQKVDQYYENQKFKYENKVRVEENREFNAFQYYRNHFKTVEPEPVQEPVVEKKYYYTTGAPQIVSTQRPATSTKTLIPLRNYQTDYIISSPRPTIEATIAPLVKQTPRLPTKVVAINKYIVTTEKPVEITSQIPVLRQKPAIVEYYDSRLSKDNLEFIEYQTTPAPKARPIVTTTYRPIVAKKKLVTVQPVGEFYDSRFTTSAPQQYLKETTFQKVAAPVVPEVTIRPTIRPVVIKKKPVLYTSTFVPEVTTRQYLQEKEYSTTSRPRIRPTVKKITITTPEPDEYEVTTARKTVKITPKPKGKTIVRVNDFHPLLTAKLGAQCVCKSNTVQLRKKSKQVITIEDQEYDEEISSKNEETDSESGIYVPDVEEDEYYEDIDVQKISVTTPKVRVTTNAVEPAPTPSYIRKRPTTINSVKVEVSSTTASSRSRVRSRPRPNVSVEVKPRPTVSEEVKARPSVSVDVKPRPTEAPTVSVEVKSRRTRPRPTVSVEVNGTPRTKSRYSTVTETSRSRSDEEKIARVVKEGLSLVKSTVKGAVKEAINEKSADFDRYGPGGLRSVDETLQGTIDCQREGLFRHPTQCNKFYACHWDCKKEKYTLHVFNCPVHLTFDSQMGACNWPSKGPACSGNTLLPSN